MKQTKQSQSLQKKVTLTQTKLTSFKKLKVKLIKTSVRNSLCTDTLNSLLDVELRGLSLEHYDFVDCIDDWKNCKPRRYL